MSNLFDPEKYWQKRLEDDFNLTGKGAGHSEFSKRYNFYTYKLKLYVLRRVIKKYHLNIKGVEILDVGSGTGYFVDFFKRFKPAKIAGIDITNISVNRLTKRFPEYIFFKIDIGAPDIMTIGKFDIINAFDVLHHIPDDRRFENAIRNLSKLAKPGAFLFLTDAFYPKDTLLANYEKVRSLDTYRRVLRGYRFIPLELIPVRYFMTRHFPLLAGNPILWFLVDCLLIKFGKKYNGKDSKLLVSKLEG